jgi:hypothetical protein
VLPRIISYLRPAFSQVSEEIAIEVGSHNCCQILWIASPAQVTGLAFDYIFPERPDIARNNRETERVSYKQHAALEYFRIG